ncbi:MAG TPA: hypothetical protein VGD77_15120 [Gemmatimonadaceae bacterium]
MRPNQRLSLALLALLAAVSGCSDVSAPTATVAVDPQPQLALVNGATYTARFVVSPSRSTTFGDGVNSLYFPAGAVCDPALSSYGPGEWDKPCTTISRDLTITVVATVANDRVNLDFSPSVRFHPERAVWLVVQNDAIKTAWQPENWVILYNPGNGSLIDEGASDRSLVTYVNRTTGTALRRIKHFSGYQVGIGITDCTPYVDPGCLPIGDVETNPR